MCWVLCCYGWCLAGEGGEPRFKPKVGKERGHAGCFRDVLVMGKLLEGQQRGPVILLVGEVCSKVQFHYCVDWFSWTVRLWVECGGEPWGDHEALAQLFAEFRSELGPSVGEDGVWKPVAFPAVCQKHSRNILGARSGAPRD